MTDRELREHHSTGRDPADAGGYAATGLGPLAGGVIAPRLPSPASIAVVALTIAMSTSVYAQGPDPGRLVPSFRSESDRFGRAVDVDGDTAVVAGMNGAAKDAVYVFARTSAEANTWTQVAILRPRIPSDAFIPSALDISGDTVIVGGPDTTGGGSAYIFERNQDGPDAWGEVARLTGGLPQEGKWFGSSVAVSGDIAVVGAIEAGYYFPPFPGRGPGSVYVFERNRGGPNAWGEVQQLAASDGEGGLLDGARDAFGSAVAIEGDVLIVGADSDDVVLDSGQRLFNLGSAYVFTRASATGMWTESAKLTAADAAPVDSFGWSIGLSGNTAVIGAPGAGPKNSGAAYVFERAGDSWQQTAVLSASDAHGLVPSEGFGQSVSISGDIVVVGAPRDDDRGRPLLSHSGSAYVFVRSRTGSDTWEEVLKLTADDNEPGDLFGSDVGVSGATAIVGAPAEVPTGPGKAYICALETVNSASGACRRQVPDVSRRVTMSEMTTSCCDSSQFVITATFANTGDVAIAGLFFDVAHLTGDNVLLNADAGPGGMGARLTPDVGDAVLSPGEAVTVRFVIGLASRAAFEFWVYPRGEPER